MPWWRLLQCPSATSGNGEGRLKRRLHDWLSSTPSAPRSWRLPAEAPTTRSSCVRRRRRAGRPVPTWRAVTAPCGGSPGSSSRPGGRATRRRSRPRRRTRPSTPPSGRSETACDMLGRRSRSPLRGGLLGVSHGTHGWEDEGWARRGWGARGCSAPVRSDRLGRRDNAMPEGTARRRRGASRRSGAGRWRTPPRPIPPGPCPRPCGRTRPPARELPRHERAANAAREGGGDDVSNTAAPRTMCTYKWPADRPRRVE